MDHTYWQKQSKDKPLFPDAHWSKPENRQFAGKLLIIGGNQHGFGAPAEAFAVAQASGIGVARVVLPDNIKSVVPKAMHQEIEFLPSNKHGSFNKSALAQLLDEAAWADVVMLAGSAGRNSETATTLESFASHYNGKLVVTEDALDLLLTSHLLNRPNTLLVAALGQLQKLWPTAETIPKHSDTMAQLAEKLHAITLAQPSNIITLHHGQLIVASNGQVSTTATDEEIWRVKTAAKAGTWWAWSTLNDFETLTSSLVD